LPGAAWPRAAVDAVTAGNKSITHAG
jgi:hypothetical protein